MNQILGKFLYYLTLPLLAVYMPFKPRARILVIADGKVLTTRSWYGSGLFTTPGGGISRRESPSQAAARELAEETGLKINEKDLQLLYQERVRYNKIVTNRHFMYLSILPANNGAVAMHEIAEISWNTPKEILQNTHGLFGQDVIHAIRYSNSKIKSVFLSLKHD